MEGTSPTQQSARWGLLDAVALVCFDAGALGVGAWIRELIPGPAGGVLAALARPAIVLPITVLIAKRWWGAEVEELGLSLPDRASWKWFLRFSLLIGAGYLVLGAVLLAAFGARVDVTTQAAIARTTMRSWQGFLPMALAWLVGAPLAEELIFRGLLYRALRERLGTAWAVPVSAALFAGAHLLWAWKLFLPITQLLGGLIFAWTYEKTRSLVHPAIFHMLGNLAVISWNAVLIFRPEWVKFFLGP